MGRNLLPCMESIVQKMHQKCDILIVTYTPERRTTFLGQGPQCIIIINALEG